MASDSGYAQDERTVTSTVIVNDQLGSSLTASIAKQLERHRGFAQHQICVMADASSSGDWNVLFYPDNDEVRKNLAVDIDVNLTLASSLSDYKTFTALLAGIKLEQVGAPTGASKFTFVISSIKGPLTTYL